MRPVMLHKNDLDMHSNMEHFGFVGAPACCCSLLKARQILFRVSEP